METARRGARTETLGGREGRDGKDGALAAAVWVGGVSVASRRAAAFGCVLGETKGGRKDMEASFKKPRPLR